MLTAFRFDSLGISYYTIFLLCLQVVSPENLTGISEGFRKQKNGDKKRTIPFCIMRDAPAAPDAAVKAAPLSVTLYEQSPTDDNPVMPVK